MTSHRHSIGGKISPTYSSWVAMTNRCSRPGQINYNNYGGRGIKICQRWGKFENFLADMGVRPEGRTLDRRDNSGDYGPDNCRWATRTQQARNARIGVVTDVDRERIFDLRRAGLTHQAIADYLGVVRRRAIGRILDKTRWGWA